MNSLQPRQRELFEKVYIQRRSYTSIAAEEGVTEAAIRNRLKKIHEKLKKSSAEGGSNGSIFSLIAKGQENVPRKGDEEMGLKHKVTINVAKPGGIRDPVLKSSSGRFRSRLLNLLFGEKVGVIVITPGDSVETVEIKEIKEGGTEHEQNQAASGRSL
jgi:hypothetical protein